MSNQLQITGGAKVRNLEGVLTGTSGVVNALGINVPSGIPQLDGSGKILVSQLPNSVMEYKGTWNVTTNTPYLVDGTGNAGDVYIVEGAATEGTVHNFGSGNITFYNGDQTIYNGSVWQKASGASGAVTSVAITESGDALTITGSPITTSGTINIGFAGTGSQYIKGDGTLATFPTTIDQAKRLITEVYNSTGATLTKGTVVYINGGQGNLPTVTKAQANADNTSAQTYGVVQSDITNMNNGFVVVFGSLTDLDTQAYAVGTQLYLSGTTAGAWTSTKPSAPIHLVYVGIVVRSHPTQGVVEIRIQNGYELEELHNVQIISPANGNILQYDSATSLWKNVAGTTTNIAEGTNLYFTNARARNAISLTTTGSTGAATYDSATGILNIPNYVDQYVGTVTSVGLSAPTGFSISGSPVTSSGTLALSFASGYSLPTTLKQSNWDDAYTWVAAFPTQTGNAGKFLTTDGSTLSWAANPLGTVTSVAMTVPTGLSVAGSPITSSGTLAVTFAAGYSIPTNTSQTNWDTAYTNRITSLTTTGTSGAATLVGNVLNIPQYQSVLTNPVTGTGASGQVAYFNGTNSITSNSTFLYDGSKVGIGITPVYKLHVYSAGNTGTTAASIVGQYYGPTFGTDSILSTYYALNVINGSGTSVIEARADNKVGIGGSANNYTLYVHGTGLYEGDVQISATSPQFITNAPLSATFAGGLSARIDGTEKARFAWNTAAGVYIYDPTNTGLSYIVSGDLIKFRVTNTGDAVFGSGITASGGSAARWVTINADAGSSYSGGIGYAIDGFVKGYSYFESGYLLYQANTGSGVKLRTNATTTALTIESGGDASFIGNLSAYGYDSTNGYFRVNRSGVYYGGIGLSNWAFGGDTSNDIAIIAKNQFKVGTNNSGPSFLIDTSGRVAINATSTSFRLSVVGDSGTWTSRIRNGNGTDYAEVYTSYGNGQHGIAIDTTSNSSGYIFKAMAGTGGGGSGSIPVIYAQNDQKIGFGNSSPNRLMEIGNGTTSSIPSWAKTVISDSTSVGMGVAISNKMLYLYMDSAGTIKLDAFNYATSTGLPVQLGGNGGAVYVNTNSPISGGGALQVNGNVNINGVFQINGVTIGGGGGSGVTGTGTTNYITKWSGSTTLANSIIYDTGTYVGIGNTSPRYRLDLVTANVDNQSDSIALGVRNGPADNSGTAVGGGLIFKVNYSGYTKGSAAIFQTAEGNYFRSGLAFFTNDSADTSTDWTEKMRLRDTGQLLIKATSSFYGASAGYNFGMIGTSSQAYISIARAGQTLDSQGVVLGLDTSNSYLTVRDNINLILQTNNTNRVTILNTGEMQVGSASVTGGGKLQVSGDVNITGNFKINGSTLTTGIGGSGTDGYVPRFNGSTVILGNSTIQDNGVIATLTAGANVSTYQNIVWKGSTSASDFSMGNGGGGMYILSSAAIDLNAPIVQRNGVGYSFAGTSSSYNVLLLNSGIANDEITILGGVRLTSTTAGFIPPRMTTTQLNALSSRGSTYCPNGTTIFDTTINILRTWNGTSWMNLW